MFIVTKNQKLYSKYMSIFSELFGRRENRPDSSAIKTPRGVTILAVDNNPQLPTAEFRTLDLIGQAEFAGNLKKLRLAPGKVTIWVALEKVSEEFVRVLLVGEDGRPGAEVGRVAKKHLAYALAYTHEGSVAGFGVLNKYRDGDVSLTVGDPKWRGH